MRTKFVIVILLLACAFLYSQAPGHLGKRLSLAYGFNTSPSIFNANGQNKSFVGLDGSSETGEPAFNAIHELSIEYATSSRWMTCFSARYYKTVYDNSENLDYDVVRGFNLNSKVEGYYTLRGLTYTLYFKYYGKRYVAPWGRYVMFGPTINTVKTIYDPSIMYVKGFNNNNSGTGNDTLISAFGTKEDNFFGVNLMLGMGRSRIISNRFVLDYGVNIHMFSAAAGIFDVVLRKSFDNTSIKSSTYIERTVMQRVRGINRFNVFLKIGYLIH